MRRTGGIPPPSGPAGPGCTTPRDRARSRPAHRPGIVDSTGQAHHQRRAQRLRGWRLSAKDSKDRSPTGPRGRACRVITQVIADDIGAQQAHLDGRCRPEGHLGAIQWPDGVRYCWVRQVTTSRSPGRSVSLMRLIAGPRTCSGISSAHPGPAGSAPKRVARRPGSARPRRLAGERRGQGDRSRAGRPASREDLARRGPRTPPRPETGRGRQRPGGQAGPIRAGPSVLSCLHLAHRVPPAAQSAPWPALRLAHRPRLPGHPGQPPRYLALEVQAIRRRCSPASPASPRRPSGHGSAADQETGNG